MKIIKITTLGVSTFALMATFVSPACSKDVNAAFFLEWATPKQIAKIIDFINIFFSPHPPSNMTVFLPSWIQSS